MNRFLGFVLIIGVIILQVYIDRFDGNFFPQSPKELAIDVISFLVFLLGVHIYRNNRRLI
jgi:hypothetical protein